MTPALREYRPDLPQLALLAANLLPLFGVLFAEWDVGSIVLLYWTENVVTGVLTVLKMLFVARLRALPDILFFCLHYGLFCTVHGALALELTGYSVIGHQSAGDTLLQVLQALPREFLWGCLALLISHGLSFLLLFIGQEESRRTTLRDLMHAPYRRIVVLHVAIIAGGFLVRALGSPLGLLLALVALKIVMDIMLHIRAHRAAAGAQDADAVSAGGSALDSAAAQQRGNGGR